MDSLRCNRGRRSAASGCRRDGALRPHRRAGEQRRRGIARPFEEFTDEQWQNLLDVNLHGAIRLIRAVLPHLPSPGGVIVNVASALALGGCPSFSIYSAAKAGMIGLTQSLAWELAPRKNSSRGHCAGAGGDADDAEALGASHAASARPLGGQPSAGRRFAARRFRARWRFWPRTMPAGLPASRCHWVGARTTLCRWSSSWRRRTRKRLGSRAERRWPGKTGWIVRTALTRQRPLIQCAIALGPSCRQESAILSIGRPLALAPVLRLRNAIPHRNLIAVIIARKATDWTVAGCLPDRAGPIMLGPVPPARNSSYFCFALGSLS